MYPTAPTHYGSLKGATPTVCACMRVYARACACMRVYARMHARMDHGR